MPSLPTIWKLANTVVTPWSVWSWTAKTISIFRVIKKIILSWHPTICGRMPVPVRLKLMARVKVIHWFLSSENWIIRIMINICSLWQYAVTVLHVSVRITAMPHSLPSHWDGAWTVKSSCRASVGLTTWKSAAHGARPVTRKSRTLPAILFTFPTTVWQNQAVKATVLPMTLPEPMAAVSFSPDSNVTKLVTITSNGKQPHRSTWALISQFSNNLFTAHSTGSTKRQRISWYRWLVSPLWAKEAANGSMLEKWRTWALNWISVIVIKQHSDWNMT